MIIYNVTCNIADSRHEEWVEWMQHKHIPDMLATGKFTKVVLVKVLVEEEMGGVTYSVQYYAENMAVLDDYYREHAPRLREEGLAMFGEDALYFRTELQIISQHEAV